MPAPSVVAAILGLDEQSNVVASQGPGFVVVGGYVQVGHVTLLADSAEVRDAAVSLDLILSQSAFSDAVSLA